jgi:hypothetical protein
MCTSIPDHLLRAYREAEKTLEREDTEQAFLIYRRLEEEASDFWREQGLDWREAREIEMARHREVMNYMEENYPGLKASWENPAWVSMYEDTERKLLAAREKAAADAKALEEANAEADALVAEIEEMIAEGVPTTERTNKIEGVNDEEHRPHREREKVPA